MFCYQCEQAAKGTGCTKVGVCGKPPTVSAIQDLLEHALRGLSLYADEARKRGVVDGEINAFTADALFSTLTNVNFDEEETAKLVRRAVELRERLKERLKVSIENDATTFIPAGDVKGMIEQGALYGIQSLHDDPDIRSLMHTVMYGLKGIAAYAVHARVLGREDDNIYAFIHETLANMLDKELSLNDWVQIALRCGEINLKTMELLDAANTGHYGDPVPTEVSLGVKKGKAILVSGHDLKDLEELLKQTEGKGINIYTHGEMLPAHGYPELKKYKHLVGHYGTAWQNQQREFAEFPGAILMTTNCIQKPLDTYSGNIFTSGPVRWPGVVHIEDHDFSPLIERAIALPGFEDDRPGKTVMTGFARNAVLSVADRVIEAVKAGKIRHFFLVGGCDGAKPGRDYYTRFVELAPKNTVVLTLACGKFRFFDKDLGDIDGIPRLLDVGQCNDAYSAIRIALALSEAFGVGVNELPLSLVLSWYEQKAVSILLTLLYLGIKDIRLGPSLPAFLTPNVIKFLVENYGIKPIKSPEEDIMEILCGAKERESRDCLELAEMLAI
ncbi:MAG: hydroxylamine reductase [Nitrospirae bacterium]|nr:MAG: hydroxylamine reductase [Nitrospirota bacterium]